MSAVSNASIRVRIRFPPGIRKPDARVRLRTARLATRGPPVNAGPHATASAGPLTDSGDDSTCRSAHSSRSTPIPTTRRSRPVGSWPRPRRPAIASCWCWRRRASSVKWPTACCATARRSPTGGSSRRRPRPRSSASSGSSSSATTTPAWPTSPRTSDAGLVRGGRRRGGRQAAGRDPRRGARRRAHRLRLATATTGTPTTSRSTTSGTALAELAGTPHVFEATMNHDYIVGLMKEMADAMPEGMSNGPIPKTWTSAMPESELTTRGRRRATSSTRSARRWPRTRHRSTRTRSSCRCRPRCSARPSATSGSSTSGVEPGIKESDLFAAFDG